MNELEFIKKVNEKMDENEIENDLTKQHAISLHISEDLIKRYDILSEMSEKEEGEELINIRARQHSIAKILVEIHNKDNYIIILSKNELAIAYLKYECFEQAIDHLNDALELSKNKNFLKEEKFILVEILKNLGIAYIEIEKYKESQLYLENAKEQCKEIIGDNSKLMAEILNLLSQIEIKNKNSNLALEYLKSSKKIYEYLQITDNNSYIKCLINLGDLYDKIKQYHYSIELYSICIEKINKNSKDFIFILIKIIGCYDKLNDNEKMKYYLIKIKNIYEEKGEKDKLFIKPLNKLIMILAKEKQYIEAIEIISIVEELEKIIYGEFHLKYGKTLLFKSNIFSKLNNKIKSIEYIKKSIEIFEELGDKNNLKIAKEKLKNLEKEYL